MAKRPFINYLTKELIQAVEKEKDNPNKLYEIIVAAALAG
tara:strand:- start:708 stop:827 length:120 start_codon:yes stop_codon:yes gene_type:complete